VLRSHLDVQLLNLLAAGMLLISFPHNPTTTCVDLEFFRQIIRLARERGCGAGKTSS